MTTLANGLNEVRKLKEKDSDLTSSFCLGHPGRKKFTIHSSMKSGDTASRQKSRFYLCVKDAQGGDFFLKGIMPVFHHLSKRNSPWGKCCCSCKSSLAVKKLQKYPLALRKKCPPPKIWEGKETIPLLSIWGDKPICFKMPSERKLLRFLPKLRYSWIGAAGMLKGLVSR